MGEMIVAEDGVCRWLALVIGKLYLFWTLTVQNVYQEHVSRHADNAFVPTRADVSPASPLFQREPIFSPSSYASLICPKQCRKVQ